ncbi:hypothetical protein Z945_1268 [Sulfitobacter noctilucae]|nr:hypothetical protein Z945_1268 [Sulfitobacter noctilucae]
MKERTRHRASFAWVCLGNQYFALAIPLVRGCQECGLNCWSSTMPRVVKRCD